MTHPDLLRLARSCAKWRSGVLLVAVLGLSPGSPPRVPAPSRMRWVVPAAVGDTFSVRLTFAAGRGASGSVWTVRATATNGTWSGLPNRSPGAATVATMIVSAMPWDSVTFNPCVWGTRGSLVSKDSTCGPALKLTRLPGPPTSPGWDTSATVIGLVVKPDTGTMAVGASRQLCAFIAFQDGKVARRTADAAGCDSIYTRIYSAAVRAVTMMQQKCADTTGYCANPSSGLQSRFLNGVRVAAR